MDINKIYHGDSIDIMRDMPDNYADLILTDPPYGIGAAKKERYHNSPLTQYEKMVWDNNRPSKEYFDEMFRISKEQIIFGANYFIDYLKPSKNWIVWDKMQPENITFSMHEIAYYSGNGQAKMFKHYPGGNRVSNNEHKAKEYLRKHPTQKPIELFSWILKNYSKSGDLILDPFCGSGTTALACIKMGRRYICIEKEKKYIDIINQRIEQYHDGNILDWYEK